jgi:prepilin-type N-terminal cleavage/methylation domain-containing protein
MKKNIFKNKKGFTLLEMMTVIVMIGIATSVAFVSMQSGKTQGEVESAAREVAAAIRSVQSDAINGKNAGTCGILNYNFNYGIPALNQYQVEGCTAAIQPIITLRNGVTFSIAGVLSFNAPWGKTGSNVTITLRKGGVNYYVCVYKSGNIIEQEAICVF